MKRIFSLLAALLLAAGLVGCGEAPAPSVDKPPTATLMIYMIGSTEESAFSLASAELDELQQAGFDLSRTNVVVCAGGTTAWHHSLPSRRKLTTLHLTADGFAVAEESPAVSMGEADTFGDFLTRSATQYPADDYALLLWGGTHHPAAGLGTDTLFDNDTLTLAEMRQALEGSPFGGDNKLRFVGIDASFSATAESIALWADYAHYLIGASGMMPSTGLSCRTLSDIGRVDTEALLASLAAASANEAAAVCPDLPSSLTCVDLSKAATLRTALDALWDAADAAFDEHSVALLAARAAATPVGQETALTAYDMVDLADAVSRLSAVFPAETAAVTAALSNVTTDGLSLYYPWNAGAAEGTHPFFSRVVKAHHTPDDTAFADPLAPVLNGDTLSLTLSDEQLSRLASARVYVFLKNSDGIVTPVSTVPVTVSGNTLTAHGIGTAVYAQDKWNRRVLPAVAPLNTADDRLMMNVTVSNLPVVWDDLPEDTDTLRLSAVAVFRRNEDGTITSYPLFSPVTGKSVAIDESPYVDRTFAKSQQLYVTRQENGTLSPHSEWLATDYGTADVLDVSEDVTYVTAPLTAGEYVAAVEIEDVSGHRVLSELVPFTSDEAPPAVITAPPATVSGKLSDGITLIDNDIAAVTLLENEDGSLTLSMDNRTDSLTALSATVPTADGDRFCGMFSVAGGESAVYDYGLRIANVPLTADGDTLTLTITLQESLTHRVLLHAMTVTVDLAS